MKKLVILISNAGTGSNLQAIIDAITEKKLNAEISAVISDKEGAKGLEHAKKIGLTTLLCHQKDEFLPLLEKLKPDFIVLAGWKQFIAPEVIDAFPGRILNLHPGLIPDSHDGVVIAPDGTPALWNKQKFTDLAIQEFLSTSYAGSTIHFLTHEFDFGPVLGRTFEKVEQNDTIESLYSRLKKKENQLYVKILQKLCNESLIHDS